MYAFQYFCILLTGLLQLLLLLIYFLLLLIFQNKCGRYWPEEGSSKEYGRITVRNISESSNNDYILREFLVVKDDLPERKIFHYHFTVSK